FLSSLVSEIRDLGHDVRVEFEPDAPPSELPRASETITAPVVVDDPTPVVVTPVATITTPPEDVMIAPEAASLNPRYSFVTFVAGPSNQLAFAASQAAASSYPPKYNPVFICGGVGLGKTHLLHAIGHQQLENRPGARIVYLSSERFMNEYVQAIRTGKMHEFRR